MGELVEIDGVTGQVSPDDQCPVLQVDVVQEETGRLGLAEAVDGDQGDDELGHRAGGPVDQTAEPVGGNRDGKADDCRHADPAGRVAEDKPFLLERLEQAAQGAGQVQPGLPWSLFEDVADVVAGDLPQAGDPSSPGAQDRDHVAEVFADRLEWHGAVFAAALASQHEHPPAKLACDGCGQFGQPQLDGLLVGVDLAGGVGDDHALVLEKTQDVPGAGAGPVGRQRPDGGVGADPGQQDPQAAGGDPVDLFIQAQGCSVLAEVLHQRLSGWGERR
ncbi:hypothetical protein [Acrocarpospora sp. B8E8]|uniref:hypothetical protein n=1 Tax=Acrocarpospora sp. B8E8 TaxID=3153572 RepID=UPI00325F07C8